MKSTKRFLFIFIILLLFLSLASCGGGREERFEGFRLQITTLKERYTPGESVIIQIIENSGSPEGYNIYKKLDEGEFERWKQDISAENSITLELEQYATYHIKVVAVQDSLEHAQSAISVEFFVSDPISPESILIKNNVIDLYHGESGADSFSLSNLEVLYFPEKTTEKGLSYPNNTYEYIEIKDNIIKTKGNPAAYQEPYVIPFSSNSNGKAVANLYIRVNANRLKVAPTDFFVGYVDRVNNGILDKRVYHYGEWVNFQCIEYAGMQKADDYVAAIKVGEEYVALDNTEFKKEVEHGIIFYKIKMPEQSGRIEYKFTAKINGALSSVTKAVGIDVEAPPAKASAIVLGNEAVTLLTGQTYQITHAIAPQEVFDKSVTYEIAAGGGNFISISSGGLVTPLAAIADPISVTVRSKNNPEVFAVIEIAVSALTQQDVITHSKPLAQPIQDAGNILFSIKSGLQNFDSVRWFKDNALVGIANEYNYQFTFPEKAGTHIVKAEVKLTQGAPIYIELPVTLESCFDITGIDEDEYEINSEISLGYQTELSDTTLLWSLLTGSGIKITNITSIYSFVEAGDYRIEAILSKNGEPIERKLSGIISIKENVTHELFNLSINGYFDGENYAPLISWHKLQEHVSYTVEIRKGAQTFVYNSTDPDFEEYFSSEGFKVPYDDVKLTDDFDYRVKTTISNKYTAFRSYGSKKINSAEYPYLELIGGASFNGYITSVYQLGKVLNYIKVFRPQSLHSSANQYSIDLYFAIDYDNDVDKSLYERSGPITTGQTNDLFKNPSKLAEAANRAYGEGASMNISFSDSAPGDGIRLTLTLNDATPIDQDSEYDGTNDIWLYTPKYGSGGRTPGNEPILNNPRTLAVSTSSQLYLAVLWGYQPYPISGVALQIYNEAKNILNQIITEGMSDAEKALAIYDWLTMNVAYDKELYNDYMQQLSEATNDEERNAINLNMSRKKSFHLQGAILEKIAVCDGISKAFTLLCAIEDIPVLRLSGSGDSGGGEGEVNHAWNAIMLDGGWYYVDATWGRWRVGRQGSDKFYIGSNHFYFLAADSDMQSSHIFDGEAPVVASERSYYFYDNDDEPIDLYFETEQEFTDFLAALPTDTHIYAEFVIAYGVEGTLKEHVESKQQGINVYVKGNMIILVILRGE